MAKRNKKDIAEPSPPAQSAKLPSESGLVGYWYHFFENSTSIFFFGDLVV
jgi:hypothetical protein